MSDAIKGLYNKYQIINRSTGEEAEGEYFVLKPGTDSAARTALLTYAAFTDNVQLAVDIRSWIERLEAVKKPEPDVDECQTDRYFKFVGPDGEVSGLFRSNDEEMIEDQRQRMKFSMITLVEIGSDEFFQRAKEMEL